MRSTLKTYNTVTNPKIRKQLWNPGTKRKITRRGVRMKSVKPKAASTGRELHEFVFVVHGMRNRRSVNTSLQRTRNTHKH